jgi:hypothetical protein
MKSQKSDGETLPPTTSKASPSSKKPTTIEDFSIIKKLGDGAYSTVYLVKRIRDG